MAKGGNLDAFMEKGVNGKEIDVSKKLKVGIIGTGWIAEAHVLRYQQMPDVEIVAGADLIPGKAEEFFKTWNVEGARCYESHKAMLDAEELDAVSVCTYNATHAECTIDALKKGVHVLLEKPMCVTTEEALEIIKAEKESGKIVSVGFQPRFAENIKRIKRIVESGVLGKIYHIQTSGLSRFHGIPTPYGTTFIERDKGVIGAVGDIGCYALDFVLDTIGYPKPLTVSGRVSDFFGKDPDYFKSEGKPAEYAEIFGVDDFASAYIRFENDLTMDFKISWHMVTKNPCDTLFMGTKGSLRIPNGNWDAPVIIHSEIDGALVNTEIPKLETPRYPEKDVFYHKVRSFLDAIKEGGASPVPTSEILYNQAIIDGIVKSSKLGREIELNLPDIK